MLATNKTRKDGLTSSARRPRNEPKARLSVRGPMPSSSAIECASSRRITHELIRRRGRKEGREGREGRERATTRSGEPTDPLWRDRQRQAALSEPRDINLYRHFLLAIVNSGPFEASASERTSLWPIDRAEVRARWHGRRRLICGARNSIPNDTWSDAERNRNENKENSAQDRISYTDTLHSRAASNESARRAL